MNAPEQAPIAPPVASVTPAIDLGAEFRDAGIGEVLDALERDLVGLAPVKRRVREIAAPRCSTSSCKNQSGSPAAMRICALIKSMPVTISVTGCSTWMRALTSMK